MVFSLLTTPVFFRYNLAQNLHDRLTNTGQDLAKMIEEINEASESLDKTTNGDEAVRLFPRHLLLFPVPDP